MDFVTQYDSRRSKGEDYTGVLKVTQPGQSFTTREIYERFLVTGRVAGALRQTVYDEDELKREPDFGDYDDTQRPDFDLSDVTEHRDSLTNSDVQRREINRLSAEYSLGNITFDEFCYLASKQNVDFARPLIERFGKQLTRKQSAKADGAKQD